MTQNELMDYLRDAVGIHIDANGKCHMSDETAGLSDDEKNIYYEKSSLTQDAYKQQCLEARYKDYFGHSTPSDEKTQQIMDEMTLSVRATSPGYLNMLSLEERTELVNEYVDWQYEHQTEPTVYGYTDSELADMSDSKIQSVMDNQKTVLREWKQDNYDDFIVWHKDAGLGPKTGIDSATDPRYTKQESTKTEESTEDKKEETSSEDNKSEGDKTEGAVENKTDELKSENGSEKDASQAGTGAWGSIVTTVAAVFAAAKTYIQEKAVPWFKEHVLHTEAQMTDEAQANVQATEDAAAKESEGAETKTTETNLDKREAADADVDYSDSDDSKETEGNTYG